MKNELPNEAQGLEKNKKNQSVIRSAAAMSLGTLSSRILGMVRDMALAAFFSRTATDAYLVAFRLPNMFRRLLGEGALSVSFIPVYIDQLVKKEGETDEQVRERARLLSSGLFSLLVWVASLLTVLGIVFMEPLIGFLVSGKGYASIPGKIEITILLGRWMFAYLFLVTQYAFFMSILNAHKKFLLPALAPAFFNLTFIIFTLLPKEWGRVEGETLAFGVLSGGLIQVAFVFFPLLKMGYLPKFRWRWKVGGIGLILRNMVPGLIGMGILQLMGLLNLNFASRLSEGTHTYIYLADRILEFPQSILAISLGAALLPTLSEFWSNKNKDKMLEVGQKHMRVLLFLALPSALGMYILALPIVQVLFMRGSFTAEDAVQTAQVIEVYSVLLIFLGIHKVTVPNFYAIKNTWLPAVTSSVGLLVHAILAPILLEGFGLQGLIYSMVVAAAINLTLLLASYRLMIGALNVVRLFKSAAHTLPGLIAMGGLVQLSYQFLEMIHIPLFGESIARALALVVSVAAGVVIYFAINIGFRHEVAKEVADKLLARFK